MGIKTSKLTVQHIIHALGLHDCCPGKTPLLQSRHLRARLDFAKKASLWIP